MPRSTDAATFSDAPGRNAPDEHGRDGAERDVLRRQLIAAEEAERRRIARELHDQLGQHLTALTLGLDEIAGLLPPDSPAVPRIAALLRLTGLLTRDVRYLAVELRPPELDDVGLESALETYVAEWSTRYGIPADLEITGGPARVMSAEASTTIYRIAQEALVNVAKHSRAKQVSIILERSDAAVRLIIEDDGCGFDVDATRRRARRESRFGLAGMQERALLAGGTFEIESAAGRGTTLFARVAAANPA